MGRETQQDVFDGKVVMVGRADMGGAADPELGQSEQEYNGCGAWCLFGTDMGW